MKKKYLIVIERAENNFGAYSPDIPGCMALGDTFKETVDNMRQSIEMHFEGMAEDGDAIPEPTSSAEYIEVEIPQPASRRSA